MKKIISWIMTLTLLCAAIPLLNQSVAEAEEAPGKTYFVSLTGNDNGPGTIEAPFATLEKARDTIRNLSDSEKKDGVTVYLREGDYRLLTAGFELTSEDSGTAEAPIVYAAYEDETVTLTGQVTLNNQNFTVVTEENADPGIWDRIPESARGKIAVYDLGQEGIPTGEILTASPTLYVAGKVQRLAENPNQPENGTANYIKPTRLIDKGWSPIDDKDQGDGLGQRPPVMGYEGHTEEARIDQWANEDEVFLRGNFAYEWLLSTLQVKVNATEKTLTGLTDLTCDESMCRFYAFNLLCELDTDGEFYIDRSTVDGERADKLYLYVGDGLGDKTVTMAILNETLLTMNAVSYVSFQGINFSNTLSTGVKLNNCESCEIKGAEVKGCSKDGIAVSGGHNVVVSGCRIHDIANSGVTLDGGDFTTLDNSKHILEYSDIYSVSGNGVTVTGVGQIVRRNHIYDLPLTAIGWYGNDHLMEFNDIENVCYDTSDAGAIYGGRSWTCRGNVMRYNFFHGMEWLNGHVIYAIYLDDALSSVEVYGNVISNWWMQGICLGGGRDIKIHDNIYIDTPGWKIGANDRTFSDWFNIDLVSEPYKQVPITNEYWAAKYPKLAATDGHLVEVWSDTHQKMYPDKSLRDVDEPDILNPMYPTGNKVYNEISVGTVNDWATLTFNDMPLISELGDFQMPTVLYDTPEAQEAYMQTLSDGIRTATMEQMDTWKADYVSTLSETPPTE